MIIIIKLCKYGLSQNTLLYYTFKPWLTTGSWNYSRVKPQIKVITVCELLYIIFIHTRLYLRISKVQKLINHTIYIFFLKKDYTWSICYFQRGTDKKKLIKLSYLGCLQARTQVFILCFTVSFFLTKKC